MAAGVEIGFEIEKKTEKNTQLETVLVALSRLGSLGVSFCECRVKYKK